MTERQAGAKEVPPGYKRTEAGVIPEDWEAIPLRDDISLLSGHHVLARHCNIHGEGVPYLTGPADFPEGHIQQTKFTTHPTTLCHEGDILVTVKGSGSGSLIEADASYCISRQLMAIRVKQWDSKFLYYSLLQNANQIKAASTGLIPGLSRSDILDQQIPLPPTVTEQRAIAAALSDVDGLIGALDALIEKKRAIKRAAMQQLLTGKKRLPGFSGEWETKRLGDIITFLPTANNPRADLNDEGEVQYIHYGDVHAQTKPVLDCNVCVLPYIDRGKIGNAAYLEDGDLIMVDASEDLEGTGKSVEIQGISGKNVIAGLHTILCRGNSDQWAMGFKAYLQFIPAFKLALTRIATGISVYAISKKQIAEIELALPPVSEQDAIVSILSDMDAEIAALERRRGKVEQIKQGMMQQLLTGRIRLLSVDEANEQ